VTAPADVVLRTSGLTKRYGKRVAVDTLDMEVHRGRVFGFLGPNGAGKTTTIGVFLGLIEPTGGTAEIFGHDTRTELASGLRRTGATIEGQSYFPHLSARDNLVYWARAHGDLPGSRIDEVLELVRLMPRAGDKVRNFSLGMKQRLAVGTAILHDPDLVILDEPTNGLDPAGIREFRDLVRQLAGEGKTVFVSSHILSEVQQMCDDVAIVKNGRLITQGEVRTLVSGAGSAFELTVADQEGASGVLAGLPWVASVQRENGRLIVDAPADRAAELNRLLGERGIWLSELRRRDSSLEEFFLEVTGDEGARA
jgi:ABC-2 type transport system ATP-binding protein